MGQWPVFRFVTDSQAGRLSVGALQRKQGLDMAFLLGCKNALFNRVVAILPVCTKSVYLVWCPRIFRDRNIFVQIPCCSWVFILRCLPISCGPVFLFRQEIQGNLFGILKIE